MSKINKVLYNVDQTPDTTEAEKAQARANIGVEALPDKTGHAGDILAVNSSATELEWVEMTNIPDTVFLAEYGVATVAEISAAKNAHKEVFTLIPGTYYPTVAYLREVTRNGSNANFASVTSDGASVKTATVDRSGNWSNSTVNLATVSASSLIQKIYYGDLEPLRVGTLLIDSDDPEGYAQFKADNVTQGYLVVGPYKGLLDSGINGGYGVGDSTTPLYIDDNGTFQTCNLSSISSMKLFHYTQQVSLSAGQYDTPETYNLNAYIPANSKFYGSLTIERLTNTDTAGAYNFTLEVPGNSMRCNFGDYPAARQSGHNIGFSVDNSSGSTQYQLYFKLAGQFEAQNLNVHVDGIVF